MAALIITNPRGITPKIAPELLGDNQAQIAENCFLDSGVVRPLKAPSSVQTLSADTVSIFKNNDAWLEFSTQTDVVQAPVESVDDRYYYTDGTGAYKADDVTSSMDLGVPQPGTGPSLTINGSGDGDIERSSVYVYTRVTDWDEESAPSKPSGVIDVENGEYVTFSGLDDDDNSHVTHYRLYRAVGGNASSEYMLVPYQISAGALKYDSNNEIIYDIPKADIGDMQDGLSDDELSIILETQNWYEPPDDLHSLIDLGNGIMAALSGKTARFCVPWVPYAWPIDYEYAMDAAGVAMAHISGIPVGLTAESVYLFDGTSPDSFQQRKISKTQGCVAKRSVVSTLQGVFFASKDGLCLITPNGAVDVLTQNVWRKEQWLDLTPADMVGTFYDGKYIAFFSGRSDGFILPLRADVGQDVTTFELTGYTFIDAQVDPASDKLFVALDDGTDNILCEFDAGDDLTAVWESKDFLSHPTNFSSLILAGDDGSSDVQVFCDDTEKFNATVAHNSPVRLPSGFLSRKHSIKVSGTTRWVFLGMAHATSEFTQNGL